MSTCPTSITQEQLAAIHDCEAVVIRELERADGSRHGRIVAWGDEDEMQVKADTNRLFIVPVGVHIVCDVMVLVCDLLEPEEEG